MPRIEKPLQQNKSSSQSSSSHSSDSQHQHTSHPNSPTNIPPLSQPLHKLSPTLQTSYTTLKHSQQQQQQSSLLLTQQTTKVLIYLKQLYLQEQSAIVKGIKEMAEESKAIIQDLTNIETQIDKYHEHIEEWIKRIEESAPIVEKIKSVEPGFKKKATNFAKLKDYLNVERPKRR